MITFLSVYLLGSSLVVSTLIEPAALVPYDAAGNALPDTGKKPPAADRALAYIAHGETREAGEEIAPFFGSTFGTIYDLTTVVILWFAGASAIKHAGLSGHDGSSLYTGGGEREVESRKSKVKS